MSNLSLGVLGSFQATLGDQPLTDFRTSKVRALLIHLAIEDRPIPREALMALLWPGLPERSARANLRQIAYYLRKDISGVGDKSGQQEDVPILTANRQAIGLNPDAAVDVDAMQFEERLAAIRSHEHIDLLACSDCRQDFEAAIELYRGHFLADFYLDDSNEFEEWAQARRELYRRQALDALEVLTTMASRQKDYVAARAYAERQLEIDDLREPAYRQLMEILALSGQRNEALAVYENCRRLLADELGMAPARRTTELYEQIATGDLTFESSLAEGVRGYELKDEIGVGAYGAIHRAVQPSVGREVAVKVIRRRYANDPEFIRRFEAEAQTVARLEHPHIVPLYDYWRDPEGAYLVMRYLKGGNLLSALEAGPWEVGPAGALLEQIAGALAAAHSQGVVHRDIKPANILLDEGGNAYLADFGIAKDLTGEVQMTAEGAVIGTPDYISPEQILNDPVTAQSDIYSLGAVLYETLTGEKPFPDASVANLIYKHLNEPVPLVSASRPDLPPEIDQVIQRATAKQPADRYASALEMAAAFRGAMGGNGLTMVEVAPPSLMPQVDEVYNPYKGLRAFQEADADDFFGREALVDQLIGRLGASHFLAVVGPSGSGKSSAVKAGLIPALRAKALPGSEKWFVAEMVPGTHPLEELELALWPVAVDPPPSLVAPMERDTRGVLRTIRRILPDEPDAQLLLVIDQFEELFTLVADEERREFFIDSLLAALRAPRSPLRVIITLRADFYDRPLQYEVLGRLLKEHTEIVLPLTAEELSWAVREPARRMGVRLENGLAEVIVADVAEQPGALPLLQYALTELFERRQNGRMTREAYDDIGGVLGALGRRAEAIYGGLDEGGRESARQLFLRLVTLGEGVEDTRRRVSRSELEALGLAQALRGGGAEELPIPDPLSPIPGVIDAFGDARLLTFDHDPATRQPTVEVAHEALLREWGRLRGWLDESRYDVRLQRALSVAAAEWEEAGQADGFLLREARLDQFTGWAATSSMALTGAENAYLQASIDAREARLAEEEARRQRELETAQKLAETERARAEEQTQAAGRLRRRAILLTGALVVAGVLAIAALFFAQQSSANADEALAAQAEAEDEAAQKATAESDALSQKATAETSELGAINAKATAEAESVVRATAEAIAIEERQIAEEQRQEAEEQSIISFSRELAAAALSKLEADPELSILLAMEGLSTRHTAEAESALHQAIINSPLRTTYFNDAAGSYRFAASPDSRTVYVSGPGGGAAVDMRTGEIIYTHEVPGDDWINRADFSPDGAFLILPGETYDAEGNNLPGVVTLADARTGQELVKFEAHDAWMQAAKFSPDGSLFGTASGDLTVKVWDLAATLEEGTGQLVNTFCCTDDWDNGLEFGPESENLAINMGNGELVVWDFTTGETRFTVGPEIRYDAEYSPDGQFLVTAGRNGNIDVWDAVSGEHLSRTPGHSGNAINHVQFNHDGSQLVSTSNDGSTSLWHFVPSGLQEFGKIPDQPGEVGGAAFTPDGRHLYTGSDDGAVRIWDISPAGSAEVVAFKAHDIRLSDFDLLADGSEMVTVGNDGMLRLWDTQNWQEINAVQAHDGRIIEAAVSPDGRLIATASTDDVSPRIWDVETLQQLYELQGHELQDFGFNRGLFDISFSPDGKHLATSGADGTARIWDTLSGELQYTLDDHTGWVVRARYSPNGKLLATSGDGTIRIWDAADGQLLLAFGDNPPTPAWGLAFSPDGNRLATGGSDREIALWQLPVDPWQATDEDVEQLFRLPSDAGWLTQMSFSPDGQRIAVPGLAELVEIRDVDSGEVELVLENIASTSYAAFTVDGKYLMTAGWDGIFRIFTLDLDELAALGQSRVTRNLTDEECRQYLHLDACSNSDSQG